MGEMYVCRNVATVLFVFLALVRPAIACTVTNYRPLSPEDAFQKAAAVIHVKVISQSKDHQVYTAKVKVLKILKGSFPGDSLQSSGATTCGFGAFNVGEEYVFFLGSGSKMIDSFDQPPQLMYNAQQILTRLQKLQRQ